MSQGDEDVDALANAALDATVVEDGPVDDALEVSVACVVTG